MQEVEQSVHVIPAKKNYFNLVNCSIIFDKCDILKKHIKSLQYAFLLLHTAPMSRPILL